jgi:hypothetical protein
LGVLAFATGVLVGACGGRVEQDRPLDDANQAIPLEQLGDALVSAICDVGASCCERVTGQVPLRCPDIVRAEWDAKIQHANSIGARYSPVQAARCVAQARQEWSRCTDQKQLVSSIEDACLGVFSVAQPTQTLGEDCVYSMDCAKHDNRQLRCVGAGSYPIRVCTEVQTSDVGGPCGGLDGYTQFKCRAPYVCGRNFTCEVRLALGADCDRLDGDPCASSLVCDSGHTNRCAPARAVGAACDDINQCENFACSDVCHVAPDLLISYYCR